MNNRHFSTTYLKDDADEGFSLLPCFEVLDHKEDILDHHDTAQVSESVII